MQSHAAIIDITSFDDTSGSSSVCTLRDAIISANTDEAVGQCAAGSGSDTIRIGADFFFQTLTLVNELPTVSSNVTIDAGGNNVSISGNELHRIFNVDGGDLTIRNGISLINGCLLYTSPRPRDLSTSRMPSSA